MAIQNITYGKIARVFKYLPIVPQIISRTLSKSTPSVFFPYRTTFTHPSFLRYYKNPPVKFANVWNAKIIHWINYPKFIDDRKFILEVNDHPLAAVGYRRRTYAADEIVANASIACEVFSNKNCAAIVLPCEGMASELQAYFGNDFDDKFVFIDPHDYILNETISIHPDSPVNFCCLASDFYSKAVDLVIDAWLSILDHHGSVLYLACPNVPENYLNIIKNSASIKLHSKAPLSADEKNSLLSKCDVSIATTHIHGGANVVEALEFGHSIISFKYHMTCFDQFSKVIDVPYFYYSYNLFGKKWLNQKDFLEKIHVDKKDGIFDETLNDLVRKLDFYILNPHVARRDREWNIEKIKVHSEASGRRIILKNLYESSIFCG